MATTIEELCEEIRASARREDFPIDVPVYERFKKDPFQPILYAGSLHAPVCIFGRDLGKDEVRLGQPLIGAGASSCAKGCCGPGEPRVARTPSLPASFKTRCGTPF